MHIYGDTIQTSTNIVQVQILYNKTYNTARWLSLQTLYNHTNWF